MEISKELDRKLKIENIERCMNCSVFVSCEEPFKENVVDCSHHFQELPESEQLVVIKLTKWCQKHD